MTDIEKMSWVYLHLEDKESRFIFEKRCRFNLTGDYQHIWDIIDEYVPEFSDCKWSPDVVRELTGLIKATGEKGIIFGAGYNGRYLLQFCEQDQVSIDFFSDNDVSKWGMKVTGPNGQQVAVISPEEMFAQKLWKDHAVIISAVTKQYYEEIYHMLIAHGVPHTKIFKFADYKTIKTLDDKQYFDQVLHFEPNEVFIDGGCCDFSSSKILLNINNSNNISAGGG